MDVENLAKELILKNMTPEQQMAVLDSIKESVAKAKEVQKRKIGENVDLVVQALKKIEEDIRSRYDDIGNAIEKRVASIKDGRDGIDGRDGKDGKDGKQGKEGRPGRDGKDGKNGLNGVDGQDGVSVVNAHIDFDGSLVIHLSSGKEINVGEVVAQDLAEKIKVITNGGGTSQVVLDTLASLQTQIDDLIPSQSGQSGKFLTTNGTALSWASVPGVLTYKGTWNASTNTPALASGVGFSGDYYVVATAGSTNLDGITDWLIGDWLIFNGATWQKIDQTNTVTSVNGQTGAVSLTTTNINEGTNLYYLDSRARQSLSAGTGISYSTSTGVITNSSPDQTVALTAGTGISTSGTYPNFTITNSSPDQTVSLTGAGTTSISGTYPSFTITSNDQYQGTVTSVTGTSPIVSSGGNTPAISIPQATSSVNGYLSSTDWSTFNNKGNGTVTSVAQSFTGGLISVSGSPITSSGTFALTVAGTSGGIPYFSSASTWASSGVLTANGLVIGNGAGAAPSTTTTGTGVLTAIGNAVNTASGLVTQSGTLTNSSLLIGNGSSAGISSTTTGTGVVTALGVNTGSSGAFVVNGGALGTPSSGTVTNLTGTASININGTVGATTPSTGAFTTLSASGVATFSAGSAAAPAITTSGDTNNGIFFPAADVTAITTAGSERLRIDSSGNVGIGTTSPSSKLEVYDATSAVARVTAGTEIFEIRNTGSEVRLAVVSADPMTFRTSNVEAMRIDSSGNVGIGTSTPTQNLSVNGYISVNSNNISADNSLGFRNRIINGDMRIDQRNAGASVTAVDGTYNLDRWRPISSQASKFTVQQNAGSVTPPSGFTKYMGCTSSSAYTVGASEAFTQGQFIEGYNVADLAWGTASAKTVTLSFYVRSSLTGTFGGAISNSAQNRAYPFSYTVSSANTWESKSITIAGDTSGTWLTDNGIGMRLWFSLGAGSTYSGTAGAWSGTTYFSATGATSVVGTNGATFYITGVQLEVGSVATPFERRPYGTELQLCQRYYQMVVGTSGCPASSTLCDFAIQFPQQMRAAPTCTQAGAVTITDVAASDFAQSSTGFSSVDGPSVYGHHIRLSNFTGLTTFRPYLWRNTNSTNNILLYSAEL